MPALWTVNGLTGVALEVVQQLAEEVSGTDVGNVTILHRLMEAKSVQEHLSNQLAAMYKLVQLTATGLRGADTEGAASHVEEVLNTEPERATIRHQQTAELAVEDRANKQEGVIHILAKLMVTGLLGVGTVNVAGHVGEALNTEPGRATIRHRQTVEQAVEGRENKQEGAIRVLAKLMATGPLGVNMVHAASLVGEAINTELAIATIRLQQTVEQDVEDRAEGHDAVTHVLVKWTVIGLHGVDTADAASHVEEDINTELASATIRHQQTVVKGVEDRADEKGAVIHILVKLRAVGLTGVHTANVVARVGREARKQDIARAPARMLIMHTVALHVEDTPNKLGNVGVTFLAEKFAEIHKVTAIVDGS